MRALVVSQGGGLGDTFLASVVARALRVRYDEVDQLAFAGHRAVLRGNPDITRVLDDGSVAGVRARAYDAVITTWATFAAAGLGVLAGIRVRVGQARRLYSPLFTTRVLVRSERGDRTTHWTQILLDYARAIDCDTADAQPRLALNDADRAEAQTLLRRARIDDGPFAVLHPTRGISAAASRWPSEPFARLAGALVARYGIPIVVTGSSADRDFGDRLMAQARTDGKPFDVHRKAAIVDVTGATSVRGFAALAARARFVVAMDSGPMHLAAATGVPTLGVFALQSDEPDRWAPLGPRVDVVRAAYPCPPQHRKETCPDFACVRDLAPLRVMGALDGLLARGPEPRLA